VPDTALILGLGGIVGTLIGGVTPLLVDSRKQRRDETRAEQEARREARQAARIVSTEVQDAISSLSTAVSSNGFWESEDAPSRAAWLDNLPRLACDLTDEEYKKVSFSYDLLKREIALGRSDDRGPVKLYVDSLSATQEALEGAKRALARLAAKD
jgi:type II secretory pathway pseudopilin PulG